MKSFFFFQDGSTPLMLAVLGHRTECVKLLLDEGADANARRKVGILLEL